MIPVVTRTISSGVSAIQRNFAPLFIGYTVGEKVTENKQPVQNTGVSSLDNVSPLLLIFGGIVLLAVLGKR